MLLFFAAIWMQFQGSPNKVDADTTSGMIWGVAGRSPALGVGAYLRSK
jgi:hypothetical protein